MLKRGITKENVSSKYYYVFLTILTIIPAVDAVISYNSLDYAVNSVWYHVLFVSMTMGYFVSVIGFLLLTFNYQRPQFLPIKNAFFYIMAITIVTLSITSLIAFQMYSDAYYSRILVEILLTISYGFSIATTLIITIRFLKWYKTIKSFVLLMYFVSFIVVLIYFSSKVIVFEGFLLLMPEIRTDESKVALESEGQNPILEFTYHIYSLGTILQFLLLWFASIIFLRTHYDKLGKFKFVVIVVLVPAFLLGDHMIEKEDIQNWNIHPLVYNVFASTQALGIGISIGLPFLLLGRKVKGNKLNYFYIGFFGFAIFFTGASAFVDHLPYPPFGLIGVISTAISPFIILMGFFGIITSINNDHKIRMKLRNYVEKNYDFLKSISEAELINTTKNLIYRLDKEQPQNETVEMSESDVQAYVNQVMDELKSHKTGK